MSLLTFMVIQLVCGFVIFCVLISEVTKALKAKNKIIHEQQVEIRELEKQNTLYLQHSKRLTAEVSRSKDYAKKQEELLGMMFEESAKISETYEKLRSDTARSAKEK